MRPVSGGDLTSLLTALVRTDAEVEVWDPANDESPPAGPAALVLVMSPRCLGILAGDLGLARRIGAVVARCPPGSVLPVLVDGLSMADLRLLPGDLRPLASVQALGWDGTDATAARLAAVITRLRLGRQRLTELRRIDEQIALTDRRRAAVTKEVDAIQRMIGRNIDDTFGPME
jgi:hypothetical protein